MRGGDQGNKGVVNKAGNETIYTAKEENCQGREGPGGCGPESLRESEPEKPPELGPARGGTTVYLAMSPGHQVVQIIEQFIREDGLLLKGL